MATRKKCFFILMTNNLAFAKGFMHSLHSAGLCATLTRPVPLTINCWSSKSMTCLAYPIVYPLDKASGFSASISSCNCRKKLSLRLFDLQMDPKTPRLLWSLLCVQSFPCTSMSRARPSEARGSQAKVSIKDLCRPCGFFTPFALFLR